MGGQVRLVLRRLLLLPFVGFSYYSFLVLMYIFLVGGIKVTDCPFCPLHYLREAFDQCQHYKAGDLDISRTFWGVYCMMLW